MSQFNIDGYKRQLSKDGRAILDECDLYIDALRANSNRTPSQLCLARPRYKTLQGAINGFYKRQNTGMSIKAEPPNLSDCLYKGVGFTVQ